jgi:hypothetical protein
MLKTSRPRKLQRVLVLPIFLALFFGVAAVNKTLHSVSLTTVSVTSSNPRPSFRGALTSGNSVGSSQVVINTTAGAYPSTSSAQLVEGDVVLIGEAGSLGSYTVASTSSLSRFTTTTALASGDADSGDDVISTSSAALTVRFTTATAIANGRFRILVPALSSDTASADGIADGGQFDFGTVAPSVTCPSTATTVYDFVAGAATASAITYNGADYHVFECAYSGTGAVGTSFSSDPIIITSLINPAPKTNHTTGTADSYNVIVQQLDTSLTAQDATTVAVGVIEAVKVTASVPAQITFQIQGLAAGTSACGVNTGVTTTAASVPFGEISISAFTNAAQAMNVSTNAVSGFAVTAIENDQLGLNGGACSGDPSITDNTSCIADARGNNGNMANSTSDEWTNASNKGFAYSLHDVNSSTTEVFAYTTATGNCTGTFCARQFADAAAGDTAVQLFSATGPADNHNLYVCYRIVAGTTTAAGNYENYVTYNATATF